MGFGDSSLFLKITFVLLIVALIIQILGVALPYWIVTEINPLVDYNSGLWKACTEFSGTQTCNNFEANNLADWFKATRAFEILGLLLLVVALILTILVLFLMSDKKILKLVGAILSFCACGFIIIGVIIFASESENDDFSGAFAITIIAGIIAFVAGILGLLDWMGKGA